MTFLAELGFPAVWQGTCPSSQVAPELFALARVSTGKFHHGVRYLAATSILGPCAYEKVLPVENRWLPLTARVVEQFIPELSRGVYLIANDEEKVIYAGQALRLRNALMEHAEGRSEQAACLRSHGADRFLFTRVGSKAGREGELQELLDFYRPACNSD